jgi:hypothetical protein
MSRTCESTQVSVWPTAALGLTCIVHSTDQAR